MKQICLGCKRVWTKMPNGLCRTCWADSEIRERCMSAIVVPEGPTEARPGTIDRIAAYAKRVAEGKPLYHPGDSKPNAE